MRAIDLIGQKFGKWTVVEKAERPPTKSLSKPLYWKCRCECGNEQVIPSHNLRCKKTLSCGCNTKLPEYLSLFNKLESSSKRRKIPFNFTFQSFLKLTSESICHYCHSPIRWVSYNSNAGYNLDRKNSQLGYSMDNCVVCCPRCNWSKANRYTYSEWYVMNQCFRNHQVVFGGK